VLELLLAIGAGATMVVVPTGIYGGAELSDIMRRERVTHAFVTPAALASVDPGGLDDLRVVIAGGEACPPELVARWAVPLSNGGGVRKFFNGYGPTETTIMTNISAPLLPGGRITIGPAIRNMKVYVLDSRLQQVPDGVAGELHIAGVQLARGYHRRSALTSERFVANPFEPGGRLYRTGDIVRSRGGEIEYVGRNDFQVKIRGFRIELGEIDAAFASHPSIDFATTVGRATTANNGVLVAYVLPKAGQTVDTAELSDYVAERLPAHMVPTSVVVLDKVPLTPVGKLDRSALPEPVLESKDYRPPATWLEHIVAGVFSELLAVERVGRDDDFFELGGNSLLATKVSARLSAALEARIPARSVFDASSVAGLAALLEPRKGEGARPALTPHTRPALVPLSLAQQRMWFLTGSIPVQPRTIFPSFCG
jgi:acyl-coenzyme A synthetase/AMP-(fatty) acid ligase/acyl carrier protein